LKFVCKILLAAAVCLGVSAEAGIKNAKYGGAFLEVGVDARILAMGSSGAAAANSVSALYWNPAGLLSVGRYAFHGMHAERFAGMVNWDFIGAAHAVDEKTAVGIGLFRMGIDGIPFTRLINEQAGLGEYYYDETGRRVQNVPEVVKLANDVEYALFLSVARSISPAIQLGTSMKILRKTCDSYGAWGLGFDAGILYRHSSHVHVGASVRDLTTTILAWNTNTMEKILPSIRLGASFPFSIEKISCFPALQINATFDNYGQNDISARYGAIDFTAGCEIAYAEKLFFRGGIFRKRLTFGAGFRLGMIAVDYGFGSHNDLGNTHRVSIEYGMKPIRRDCER